MFFLWLGVSLYPPAQHGFLFLAFVSPSVGGWVVPRPHLASSNVYPSYSRYMFKNKSISP
eukprot:NODE_1948_length_474_cov_38.014118_g1870_i0.p1 GENE.NODE_1948_length_474_cov_38.014118_g1870_i0~~NODE_1948_length_474_cov_38.014118_g1870_i0.p1  ORF type:complete len:60 (-),score=8.94 NODE_1948_length_474_cov_38.014118_g1870_i0:187-366(-)